MEKVTGSVSIHRLRTGETVQLYLSADRGLYQLVSGNVATPDWTSNSPTITPEIPNQKILHPAWYKDGQIIAGWYKEGNTWKEKATAAGYSFIYTDQKQGALTITKSPVDFSALRNINYTFRCEVSVNGGTPQSIERTIMVTVHNGGENSYWGNINAPRTVLSGTSGDEYSTTLTPVLYLGSEVITNFDVIWKRTSDNVTITNASTIEGLQLSGKNLIVNRKGVNGAAHFTCTFLVGGTEVEAEGIQIADKSDNYYINLDGANDVYVGGKVDITPTLVETENGTAVAVKEWQCVVTDSVRINKYPASMYTFNSKSGVFSMNESNMYVPNVASATMATQPWLKTDVLQSDGKTYKDVPVNSQSDATPCDINVTYTAVL